MSELVFQFSTPKSNLANWASAAIRRITHSWLSHVDIVLADEELLGASDSPDAPCKFGNPRGVAIRPANYQDFALRFRMHLAVAPEVYDRAIKFYMAQVGKPFDHEALHGFLSDNLPTRDWRGDQAWFCGELAACGMEGSGYWPRPLLLAKDKVSAVDFLNLFLQDPNFVNWREYRAFLSTGGRV